MVKSCQAPFFLLRWKQLSSGGFFHFVEDGLLMKILIILLEIVATCYQVLIHFETRLQKNVAIYKEMNTTSRMLS